MHLNSLGQLVDVPVDVSIIIQCILYFLALARTRVGSLRAQLLSFLRGPPTVLFSRHLEGGRKEGRK